MTFLIDPRVAAWTVGLFVEKSWLLRVRCACGHEGARSVPICGRRRRPEAWAVIVLSAIVACHHKRQAEERRRQEREAIRLGGKRRRRTVLA